MISRYEVTLNGASMAEIHENLLILDVQHSEPAPQFSTYTIANRDGSRITSSRKNECYCTVSFELHIYSIAERQEALQDVITWARAGGILKTNDRPDQHLVCVCDGLPAITSVRNWTDPLTVKFAAAAWPYWEEDEPTTLTLSGTTGSGTMEIPGNGADAFVECTVVPAAAMTSATITAGSTTISLSGISVAAGDELKITYTADKIIQITNDGTSVLNKRTPASSDDLKLPSGAAGTVSFETDASASVTFMAKGCWE